MGSIFSKPSPQMPPTPDYPGMAVAQGVANEATARINAKNANPNIKGPLGSQMVSFEGDQPTITQTLTPTAQSTLEAQQRVQGALASLGERGAATASGVLGTPFDSSGAPLQTRLDLSNVARMPVNAGTTGQEAIMARLQPQIERMDAQTRTRLANQGLVPGGEAYQNAMMDVNQQKNDLMSQAALQGLNLDIGAQAQGFGQATNQMGVQNAAEQAELQRRLALRGQPLNEISGLMSGSQIMMPQFQGYQPSPAAPPPIMQGAMAQGQNAMQNYGMQSANANAQTAGLYGLAGAGLGAAAYNPKLFGFA